MEQYNSIPSLGADNLSYHTWEKIDGSNLRFEYSKNKGFYKFGSRSQLIDKTNMYGEKSIDNFLENYAPHFEEYAKKNKIEGLTVFCELAGKSSFAGQHNFDEELDLYVIDLHIKKRGFLEPNEYLNIINKMNVKKAKYLGTFAWNENFIDQVKNNKFPGQTLEGVVGKRFSKNKLYTNKAKSNEWIELVKNKFGKDADKWI